MTAIGGRALRDALRRYPYHVGLAALAAGLAGAPAPLELAFAVAGAAALMLACVRPGRNEPLIGALVLYAAGADRCAVSMLAML